MTRLIYPPFKCVRGVNSSSLDRIYKHHHPHNWTGPHGLSVHFRLFVQTSSLLLYNLFRVLINAYGFSLILHPRTLQWHHRLSLPQSENRSSVSFSSRCSWISYVHRLRSSRAPFVLLTNHTDLLHLHPPIIPKAPRVLPRPRVLAVVDITSQSHLPDP